MKKFITILIVIIVISIIIICGILIKMTSNKDGQEIQEIIEEPDDLELSAIKIDNIVKIVNVRNEYYIVKDCITKYYDSCMEMYQNEKVDIEASVQTMYGLLDKRYIEFKEITIDNVVLKLDVLKDDILINIDNMYMCQKSENVASYFVYGTLMNKSDYKFSEFSIMVNLDMLHRTFSICLDDYIKDKYNVIKLEDNVKLEVPDSIEENIYNKFDYKHISDEQYAKDLYEDYKNNVIYNKETAYNSLDNEYRKTRFGTLKNYEKYAKNSVKKLVINNVQQYNVTKKDDYTQYVIIDTVGNYYIFKETAPMKYTVFLDTYTIDIPEFVEKYDSTNEQGKVVLNIQKFMEALNGKDTNYIYSILSDNFKKNKFKTEEDLKKYINKNLGNNYNVEYETFKNEGEIYIYDIILKDKTNDNKAIKMQIIMQLLEDRKFAMSFSIQSK